MKHVLRGAALIWLHGTAVYAAGCDGLPVLTAPRLLDITPFASDPLTQVAVLHVPAGSAGCVGSVYIGRPSALTPVPSGALQINAAGSKITASDDAGGATSAMPAADIKGSIVLPLQVIYRKNAASDAMITAGVYRFAVPIEVRSPDGLTIYRRIEPNLEVEIPSQAHVRIVSADGRPYAEGTSEATVNFGMVQTGSEQNFFINVRNTGAYKIDFYSDNGFALQREGSTSPAPAERLPYVLQINGNNVAASGKNAAVPRVDTEAGSRSGSVHRLSAKIGDTDNKKAGHYTDVLTVTVSPA